MSSPTVSVVIPVYNRAHTIERALASVWIQDVADMEVIAVDDGSSDGTRGLLADLQAQDARLRLCVHERNKGEAAARNTGVRAARGRFIAFLDSDDEWLPGKLVAQLASMEASDASVAAVCTGQYIVDGSGHEEVHKDWTTKYVITDRNLLIRGCGVSMGNTFLIEREVFGEVGYYDEELPLLVDLDWLCRFASRYRIQKIQEPLARYHKAPIRRGEIMEQAVARFVAKNRNYLHTFSYLDRLRIQSQFFNYISLSYLTHGPWRKYAWTRAKHFACGPWRSPRSYAHYLSTLVGLIEVGKGG